MNYIQRGDIVEVKIGETFIRGKIIKRIPGTHSRTDRLTVELGTGYTITRSKRQIRRIK